MLFPYRGRLTDGNNPYAGVPGVIGAGQTSVSRELIAGQMDMLRRIVADIVSRAESCPPEGFVVGSEFSTGTNGPLVIMAVHPPIGHSVNASLSLDADDLDARLTDESRSEVARGLVASAAFQVISAAGDDFTFAAR